jgi:hypothetical protein
MESGPVMHVSFGTSHFTIDLHASSSSIGAQISRPRAQPAHAPHQSRQRPAGDRRNEGFLRSLFRCINELVGDAEPSRPATTHRRPAPRTIAPAQREVDDPQLTQALWNSLDTAQREGERRVLSIIGAQPANAMDVAMEESRLMAQPDAEHARRTPRARHWVDDRYYNGSYYVGSEDGSTDTDDTSTDDTFNDDMSAVDLRFLYPRQDFYRYG